jgi:hypothetical protein
VLDRGLRSLGTLDQPADLTEDGPLPDPRRLEDERARRHEGAAEDRVRRPLVDRHRLAREHRLVDRGQALTNHAVDRDLLPRPNANEVPHHHVVDRDPRLGVAAQDRCLFCSELEEASQRAGRPALGPVLEVLPEQQERDDDPGDLEIDVAAREQGIDRIAERRQGAEGDERVHVRGPVTGLPDRAGQEGPPGDELHRSHEGELHPARPLRVRAEHRERERGRRQHRGEDEAPPRSSGFAGLAGERDAVVVIAVVTVAAGSDEVVALRADRVLK